MTNITRVFLAVYAIVAGSSAALAHPSVLPQFTPGPASLEERLYYDRFAISCAAPSYDGDCDVDGKIGRDGIPYPFKKKGPAGLLAPLIDK
jgi:hypothetical protein